MVSEISIANFRSIEYQKFSLARVNVFVGDSDSGKTNILEAVGMAAAAHDDALDTDSLRKRGIRVTEPSLMFHASVGQEQRKEIVIVWREKLSVRKAILVLENSTEDAWKDISWYEPAYVDMVNNLIKCIGNGSIKDLYPYSDPMKNTVLNNAFRGSRYFRGYRIYHALTEHQLHQLLISRSTPAFFAIDRIENSLKPECCNNTMNIITSLAAKHRKQILISTSRPDMIQKMNLNDPEQKFFHVKRTEDEQTIVEEMKN
jgi:predicted ATPase